MAAQIPRAQHRRGTATIEVEEMERFPSFTSSKVIPRQALSPLREVGDRFTESRHEVHGGQCGQPRLYSRYAPNMPEWLLRGTVKPELMLDPKPRTDGGAGEEAVYNYVLAKEGQSST